MYKLIATYGEADRGGSDTGCADDDRLARVRSERSACRCTAGGSGQESRRSRAAPGNS